MNIRPLAVIGIAFVVAACIGLTDDPTSAPTTSGPTPTRSPFDFSKFTPFPVVTPAPTCPDVPVEAELVFEIGGVERSMSVSVIEARTPSGASASFVPPHASHDDLGNLPGGIPITVALRSPDGSNVVDAGISASASLVVAGATQQLKVGRTGDTQSFVLPDVDSTARLEFAVTFNDLCHAYRAVGSATAYIGSRDTVAACPRESADRDAYLAKIWHGQQLTIDGHAEPMAVAGGDWSWLGGSFATDSGTLFGMWDHDAPPLVGSPSSEPTVRLAGASRLTFIRTRFYRKDDAIHEQDRAITFVSETSRDIADDGTTRMPLPTSSGQYVTFMQVSWQTPCLSATSIANFEVDVK